MSDEANNEGNESAEKDKARRASEITRAYRIRKKIKEGKAIDGEEKKWFDSYEANKRQLTPQGSSPAVEEDGEAATPAIDEPATDAPAPPAPPRVSVGGSGARTEERDSGDTKGGDWRKRYRGTGKAGREQTVLAIASQWRGALEFMSEQIKMSGGTPMIPVDELWPHIVITVDDMLPEKIQLKPSHIAVGGSTVLLAQRIARNKKIGEAYGRGAKPPDPNVPIDNAIPFPGTQRPPDPAPEPAPPSQPEAPPAAPPVHHTEPPAPITPPIRIPVETDPVYTPGPDEIF